MKKIVVTILALLYLSASVGATVHFHYCMDKLVDWGLEHSNDKTCDQCGMEKSHEKDNGCCKDEHKQVKLENDHKGAIAFQLAGLMSIDLPAYEFELPQISFPAVTGQHPLSHAPPGAGDIAVYIRNCVFRI